MRISDWSSDVRSSDLPLTDGTQGLDQKLGQRGLERAKALAGIFSAYRIGGAARKRAINADQIGGLRSSARQSVVSGKCVSVLVDLGVRRIINKKKKKDTIVLHECR